ncbi:MAG: GmrSD restriction endonuclease domain-containing protein [Candidatus Pacearchaeota archaeon]
MQKYSVNQQLIETILSWVKAEEIAIPEMQRPFVWDATKVRDLMDSLYQGFPVGYLIVWRNPDVNLKDGSTSEGKKILIDGQQRVTALKAAILGDKVMNKDYKWVNINIAFNPIDEKFEVSNPAIEKDETWIPSISEIFSQNTNFLDEVDKYYNRNQSRIDKNKLYERLDHLKKLVNKQIGLIELNPDLDIEDVTEIFIRINSEGVVLGQSDFVMSKIAAAPQYDGPTLRKAIDYFCHLAVMPEFYHQISEADEDFKKTEYFSKMYWLKNEKDDLYDPDYTDMIRVAFTKEFERGKLADLVSLLSGRNFETRTFEESIEAESFARLKNSIMDFMNETNFKRFLMIIKSAGFISPDMIRSQNALNFAYIAYLKLKEKNYLSSEIENLVRRWFVMSILTGRYSGSAESMIDFDIKNISANGFAEYLDGIENADLSNAFWESALVQHLDTSVASSPYFNVFLAAQVKNNDRGFLSKEIKINELITHRGDIHHIFPREYLKSKGLGRSKYNQIANYVYMQTEINIKVGKKAPNMYFKEIKEQVENGSTKYGGIKDIKDLRHNLKSNCIPIRIFDMDVDNYDEFLKLRRKLMAEKIKDYYISL